MHLVLNFYLLASAGGKIAYQLHVDVVKKEFRKKYNNSNKLNSHLVTMFTQTYPQLNVSVGLSNPISFSLCPFCVGLLIYIIEITS